VTTVCAIDTITMWWMECDYIPFFGIIHGEIFLNFKKVSSVDVSFLE